MIRTTRVTGGIKVEVIREKTGQVTWQKFVPWRSLDRLPEVFEYASREEKRYGKTEDATSNTTGHGRGPQDEQDRPVRKEGDLPPESKDQNE
jgi:hypothetical protein